MIRFADMDGDGLADFLAVANDGSIQMWRNMGVIGAKGSSLRLADLTGDGKADIISVDAKGRAMAWLNKGLGSWDSIGEIAPGLDEDLSSASIEFADVNGDGKADYLVIYGGGAVKAFLNNGNIPDTGKDRIWQPAITISPGVGEPGQKVTFADLNGDGYADYIVIYDGGAAKAWLNNKNIPPKNGERIWATGQVIATGVGEPGSKVRFADLTGDGKAEYIIQYTGGAAIGYGNTGDIPDAGKARKWVDMGTIAAGVSPQGPVRYADINGDGKADYLVVFGGGAINAYVNTCDWKVADPGEDNGGGDDDDNDDEEEIPEDEQCQEDDDRTYSKDAPDSIGEYMRWFLMEPEFAATTGRQYVTIVNLTPHHFKLTSTHSYQMDEFDWGDIPSGRARQNIAHYTENSGSNPKDDNGEAYYTIEGTSHKFTIRVTTHIPDTYPRRVVFDLSAMGAGQREYKVPEQEVPVTLFITGSASYGFITSLRHGPGNWMNAMRNELEQRKLLDVVMPGSHDAGMSKLTDGILSRGVESNTQTQMLNINEQLWAGSRWFDMRVMSVHQVVDCCGNYKFWTAHISDDEGEVPIGRTGETFDEVIGDQ